MLRWRLQQGRSVDPQVHQAAAGSPRTSTSSTSNSPPTSIAAIDALDTGRRGGPEPDAITLETFGREIPEA